MTGPARPRIYLHVGEPKCGTTFLQDVLWRNRGELARHGVLLPGVAAQDQYRAQQDLRNVRQSADDPSGSWTGEWDILARQARQAERIAVISHELLAGADADQAARGLASLHPAEVHVVLTVRDPASLLPAEWQETVKHGNQQAWDRWLAAVIDEPVPSRGRVRWFWTVHDTVDVLRRWSRDLPPQRVHVVTVPPSGSPPTLLWDRFAQVIGVDPAVADTGAARPNASLGVPEVEMLRRLNRRLSGRLPHWFYARRVKGLLAHRVLGQRPVSARLRLPPERQAWADRHAEKLIQSLRAAGYGIVGDLDELRPTPGRSPADRPADVTDEQLLDAALDSLAHLLENEYERTSGPAVRPRIASRPTSAVLESRRLRHLVRDLSTRHQSVAQLRVLGWRVAERTRARRTAP